MRGVSSKVGACIQLVGSKEDGGGTWLGLKV